jgi:hypothetical protein
MPTTRHKSTSSRYEVRARGLSTLPQNLGQEIPIYWGMYYGMGGFSCQAWAESGPVGVSLAEAREIAQKLCNGGMHGFRVVPNSAKIFKIDTETVTYTTEEEIV